MRSTAHRQRYVAEISPPETYIDFTMTTTSIMRLSNFLILGASLVAAVVYQRTDGTMLLLGDQAMEVDLSKVKLLKPEMAAVASQYVCLKQ